jgi:pSer/pThr/pTyr-binding forkhead associated (FHA) protein
MSIRLYVQEEGGELLELEFDEPVVLIGRGPDNHVVIADARGSRKHCSVSETPHGAVLEDLGSSNGTVKDGEPVKRTLLEPGDVFRIGKTEFHFQTMGAAATATPDVERAAPIAADGLEQETGGRTADADDILEFDDVGLGGASAAPSPLVDSGTGAAATVANLELAGPKGTLAREAVSGDDSSSGVLARLELVEGRLDSSVIDIVELPFTVGRASDCDLTLQDPRVSNAHAEIIRKEDFLVVCDLGSRNGTVVDDRRVKKGAILTEGTQVVFGNHLFTVHLMDSKIAAATAAKSAKRLAKLRSSSSSAAAASASGESAPEAGKLSVDVDSLLRSDHLSQLLSVAALVVIASVVAYFVIDISVRVLSTEVVDPAGENNLVENWSFETVPSEGESASTPGWRANADAPAELSITSQDAREPGTSALLLTAPSAGGKSRGLGSVEQIGTIDAGSGRRFLLEGFVVNQNAFFSGLGVTWLSGDGDRSVVVGRSLSTCARGRGESIEVSQVVAPPSQATAGRLFCYAVGPGTAIFDQVSLTRLESEGAGASVDASEDGAADKRSALEVLVATDGEPILVGLRGAGSFHVRRGSRLLIPEFWAGLPLENDPYSFGPHLSEINLRPGDGGRIVSETNAPDLESREFANFETSAGADASSVSIRWRLAAARKSDEGESEDGDTTSGRRALVIHVHSMDPGLPVVAHGGTSSERMRFADATGGPFVELVFAEEDVRTSFDFSVPVKIRSAPHPVFPRRSLMLIEPLDGSVELGLIVSHGSRREAQSARLVLSEAERLFGEGRDAAALVDLSTLAKRYPLQETEIAQAATRIERWNSEAGKVIDDLDQAIVTYRENPSRVVFSSLLARIDGLAARYRGTPKSDSIEAKARVLAKGRESADRGAKSAAHERLLERANVHVSNEQPGLAELLLKLLLEDAPSPSDVRRNGENLLKRVKTRQGSARERVLLGS